MNKFFIKFLILFFITTNNIKAEENIMILKLKDGDVKIELFPDVAPNHTKRIKELADQGKYDNVYFIVSSMVLWHKLVMYKMAIHHLQIII